MSGLFAVATLTSCNNYDLYRVAGYEQASFSNEADIIFVVDNSPSMVGESEALALTFNTFLDALIATEGSEDGGSLSDAVGGYVTYVTDRGALIDYQMGITTTSVDTSGAPGDGGRSRRRPPHPRPRPRRCRRTVHHQPRLRGGVLEGVPLRHRAGGDRRLH